MEKEQPFCSTSWCHSLGGFEKNSESNWVLFVKSLCVPGNQILDYMEAGRSGWKRQKVGLPYSQGPLWLVGFRLFEGSGAWHRLLAPRGAWWFLWREQYPEFHFGKSYTRLCPWPLGHKTLCNSSWESVPVWKVQTPGCLCIELMLSLLKLPTSLAERVVATSCLPSAYAEYSTPCFWKAKSNQILINITFNKSLLHDFLQLIWTNYTYWAFI